MGLAEIACLDFMESFESTDFIKMINDYLPEGFKVIKAEQFIIPFGVKKYSPASVLWGFSYGDNALVAAKEDKVYRASLQNGKNTFGIIRNGILAKNPDTGDAMDYFCLYRKLYP